MIRRALLGTCCTTLVLAAGLAAHAAEALYFGDMEGTVEIPAGALPQDLDRWSVECRVKLLAQPTQPVRLLSQWDDPRSQPGKPAPADRGRFHLSVGPPGHIVLGLRTADGRPHTITATWAKPDDAWHHLAVTWDQGRVALLLDGQVVGRKIFDAGVTLAASERPLVVGHAEATRKKGKSPPLVRGFIAEVAIWRIPRAAATIVADLPRARTGDEEGLVACYPLLRTTTSAGAGATTAQAAPLTLDDVASLGAPADEGPRPDVASPGLPRGVPDAGVVGPLSRAGWYETPLWSDPNADKPWLYLARHDLSAQPEPLKKGDTAALPVLNGSIRRLVANDETDEAGVLWQDPQTKEVYVTWVEPDLSGLRCAALPALEKADLVAATSAPAGHLYYLMIEPLPGGRPESEVPKAVIRLVRPDGTSVHESPVDMGPGAFSWYTPHGRGNMAYADGGVSVILPRTFCNGDPTGKAAHHQGAVTATFSADLAHVSIFGNSASHSLGSTLSSASSTEALGLELGDCFPRALQLHKFMRRPDGGGAPGQPGPSFSRVSKVVYNYVCNQITIGEPGQEMKVAHDGNTYTELGGVAEGQLSYSVVFAADRSPEGKTLDYGRVGQQGDPRDIALLRVVKNFETVPGGYDVQDALMVPSGRSANVPTPAPVETGEFRVFTGAVCQQRNTGLIWLTDYDVDEAAHAPHVVRRRDGTVLIIWEKTGGTDGAPSLWAMVIHESGQKIVEPVCLGIDLEMDREDPVIRVGHRDCFLARDRTSNAVQLCWFLDP